MRHDLGAKTGDGGLYYPLASSDHIIELRCMRTRAIRRRSLAARETWRAARVSVRNCLVLVAERTARIGFLRGASRACGSVVRTPCCFFFFFKQKTAYEI